MNQGINRVGGEIPLLCFVSTPLFIVRLWEGEAIKLQNPTPLLKMNKKQNKGERIQINSGSQRPLVLQYDASLALYSTWERPILSQILLGLDTENDSLINKLTTE